MAHLAAAGPSILALNFLDDRADWPEIVLVIGVALIFAAVVSRAIGRTPDMGGAWSTRRPCARGVPHGGQASAGPRAAGGLRRDLVRPGNPVARRDRGAARDRPEPARDTRVAPRLRRAGRHHPHRRLARAPRGAGDDDPHRARAVAGRGARCPRADEARTDARAPGPQRAGGAHRVHQPAHGAPGARHRHRAHADRGRDRGRGRSASARSGWCGT